MRRQFPGRLQPLSRLCPLFVLVLLACGDPIVVLGDKPGTLRRVAGIPDSPGATVGDRATDTKLSGPSGLAVDASGRLFVADQRNSRIVAVGSDGSVSVVLDGRACSGDACIETPVALASDAVGRILIADRGIDRVLRFDPVTGALEVIAGSGIDAPATEDALALESPLLDPQGVAVLASGDIVFSETGGHRVWRIGPEGRLRVLAGSGRAAFGGDGQAATAAHLRGPTALAASGDRLYIADTGNQRVRAVDLDGGTITTVAGTGTRGFGGDGGHAAGAQLDGPSGLAVGSAGGRLYIADRGNHRIRLVHLASGTIDTFAGTGSTDFTGELLDAGDTALSEPAGVALAPRGFLFIADTGHHIVWRTPVGL